MWRGELMATKKRDFSLVTERALRRPTNMSDFLDNGEGKLVDTDDEKSSKDNSETIKPSKKAKDPEKSLKSIENENSDSEKSSNLSEQTTVYMELRISEILDDLWIQLRRKAPKGGKKRISKSLIINKMIEYFGEQIKNEGFSDNKLVQMILLKE